MRALRFDGSLQLHTDEVVPAPQNGEVLIKVLRAGICNTDIELTKGYKEFSGILGHEFVGEVLEGPDEWRGQRVVADINVACHECDMCHRGFPSHCRNRRIIGITDYGGAFADYLVVPIENLHKVPKDVSDDAAVFTEPLAACLQIPQLVHIKPDDSVILIGAGKLGLLAAQVLKLTGANVRVVIRHERQRVLLEKWGIPTLYSDSIGSLQVPTVVDCTGNSNGFADALRLVEPRGKILLKSTYSGIAEADLTYVVVNEIQIIGTRCGPFEPALNLLQSNRIDVTSLIDARYPIDDAVQAIDMASKRGILKIILDL